ncbi:MAG: GNAT family acetyltransferase [Erysipelotrichaceae bacterium]|nr:GNAT family acetyltransferase [Erysipelotrichaceae bacterium]
MNKLLVLCEGSNEKKIIDLLLENNKLIFTQEDLVGLVTYHARQLNASILIPVLSIYQGSFDIYRIGDKQNEILKIPKSLKHRIGSVTKYCTKPELEVLLLINEGMYYNYLKNGNNKPKQYAKEHIIFNKQKYDNSTYFYQQYYENSIDNLVDNIKKYKTLKEHKKDELYLADLLK